MTGKPKGTRGIVLLGSCEVRGERFWHAAFFKEEPPRGILHVADRVLVDTASRAARTREVCEAKARAAVAAMGYPEAEFRLTDKVADTAPEPADEGAGWTP